MKLLNISILLLLSNQTFAEDSSPAGALGGLPFLVIMFALMYFLLIRPQQKRAKEHKTMMTELAKGDEVVTNGGILGKVIEVDDSSGLPSRGPSINGSVDVNNIDNLIQPYLS